MTGIPAIPWHMASSVVVPLAALGLMIRRNLRERRVRTARLWIYPVILGGLTAVTVARGPVPGIGAIAGFVASAAAGAGFGYLRARHQQLSRDPQTGQIVSRATPLGLILIAGFFVLRYGLEFFTHTRDLPHALGLQRATDAGLIFSTAMIFARQWEIWCRTRALMGEGGPAAVPQIMDQAVDQAADKE
jgi:hypothetical protein